MDDESRNPLLAATPVPVEVVFHPSWWHRHAGLDFGEDFFYHPKRRVEVERKMEAVLHEKFGGHGLGADRDRDLPVIGAVHNAAGYLLSEMLGCRVDYLEDAPPQVVPAGRAALAIDAEAAFRSRDFTRLLAVRDALVGRFGYVTGDVNWGGVLNIALDLVGQDLFLQLYSQPEEVKREFAVLAGVIERFVTGIAGATGTSSVSVNRTVRHLARPVFLHSECSNTMISAAHYEEFLLPIDVEWSRKFRPFGIHYCGKDAHRYARSFAKIENLDFLDVGWGSDVKTLRQHLPRTFLNIRLDAMGWNDHPDDELAATIERLVGESGNPWLTGVCCINLDDKADPRKVRLMFEVVADLRARLVA
ncbi:MAG: hypothetical protein U0599_24190 [Vicinamibacteria bacterium]